MNKTIEFSIPKWATLAYIIIAIVLIPWTVYLGFHLPTAHITLDWDVLWVGLDLAIILTLLLTGIFAAKKSIYTIIFATINASLFLTDAWFDVFSYRASTYGSAEAIIMAIFGEIPMAIFGYSLAIRGLERLHQKTKH